MFSIRSLFLWFFSPLITVFWFSISSFNKKNYCFIFFQFDRHYFNLFFIFVKAIFQFILTLQLKIFVCLLFFFHPHYFRSFCVIIFFLWFYLLTFDLLGIRLHTILSFCISFFLIFVSWLSLISFLWVYLGLMMQIMGFACLFLI